MRKQTELNSGERLGALTAPKYLLVPPDLEITALQVLASQFDYTYALANGAGCAGERLRRGRRPRRQRMNHGPPAGDRGRPVDRHQQLGGRVPTRGCSRPSGSATATGGRRRSSRWPARPPG